MPAVEVDAFTKRYSGRTAVGDLTFSVEHGEIFALVGPNGAGKTTTLETVQGYRRPDSGSVRVLGCDPRRAGRRIRAQIGVMPQGAGLYAGIRPAEAVRLFASYYAAPEEPLALLERAGIDPSSKTPWRRMSGGQQQRLSLALALVGRPDVLILDEPTSGLDVQARAAAWDLIRESRDRGAAVLVTTHLLEEAERHPDRIGIISRGRLVASGSPAEVAAAATRRLEFTARPGLPVDRISASAGSPVTEGPPGRYSVAAEPDAHLVARLTQALADLGVLVSELRTSGSLEDVFNEVADR